MSAAAGGFWSARGKAYLRCFLRTYVIAASMNPRGLMSAGLLYAMHPGLWAIHSEPRARELALRRYARHFSIHPFWAPCLVGIFLNVESEIAARRLPPQALEKIKTTTSYTLSAIGDSVFGGSVLILWVLLTSCLLLLGQRALPFGLGLFFFLGLQGFRVYSFLGGVRKGFRFLAALKRWDLINWGRRIKFVNAALILWLWHVLFPAGNAPVWAWGMGALAVGGALTLRPILPRWIVAGVVLGLLVAAPWGLAHLCGLAVRP